MASFNPEKLKGDEEFHVAPPTHLIVVAGHAVMRLSNMKIAAKSDDGWYLLPYQRNIGFPAIICAHIKAGISLAKSDASNSILVFSGGQTRRDVGYVTSIFACMLVYMYICMCECIFIHSYLHTYIEL